MFALPAQRGGSGCGFNARIEPGLVNRLVVRGGNGCGLRLRMLPGLRTPGAAEAEVFVVTMAATTAVAAKAAIFQDIVMLPSTRIGLKRFVGRRP